MYRVLVSLSRRPIDCVMLNQNLGGDEACAATNLVDKVKFVVCQGPGSVHGAAYVFVWLELMMVWGYHARNDHLSNQIVVPRSSSFVIPRIIVVNYSSPYAILADLRSAFVFAGDSTLRNHLQFLL